MRSAISDNFVKAFFATPQLTINNIVFLAHFTHTPLPILEATEESIVYEWYESAIEVHNHLNTPPKQ